MATFRWEKLNSTHVLQDFDCQKSFINNYLINDALTWQDEGYNACWLLLNEEFLVGFFTLSPKTIDKRSFSEEKREGLPANVPVLLLGMMGIDKKFQGKGYSGALLIEPMKIFYQLSAKQGGIGILLEPLDDDSERFFVKYGFTILEKKIKKQTKLLLPKQDIIAHLKEMGIRM